MFNAESNIEKDDLELLSKIQNKGIKNVVIINKMDKVQKSIYDTFLKELEQNDINNVLSMSIYNNQGIEELKNMICKIFNTTDLDYEHELIITNSRHKDLLKKSVIDLKNALVELDNNKPIDIIFINLKSATKHLGEIVGTDVSSDVVHKIFEKFCLGK